MRNYPHLFGKFELRHLAVSCVLIGSVFQFACDEADTFSLLTPDLEVSPDPGTRLAFDQVVLTRTKVGPVRVQLKNNGPGFLTVENVRIVGPGSNAYIVTQSPKLVIAGQTKEVVVRFDPVSPGDHEAALILETNDSDFPKLTFPLSGNEREPCVLFANQSRLVFLSGDTHEVTLSSLSSHACVIDRLFVDRSLFPILDEPPVPFTIPGGSSVKIAIQHVAAATSPGIPVRELLVRESEGSEVLVLLEGEAPLSGCLTAFPNQIVFPQTERGQTRRQRVQVTNRCSRAATLTSVVVGRAWDAFKIDEAYPQIVPPGGSRDVWIKYVPQT